MERKMSEAFNWCFIGTGRLANKVAKEILTSPNHKIVSVFTRNFEKGKDFASKYGAIAYKTAEEAIEAEGVDGVYVVTPHNSHHLYAKLSLSKKKPTLVEKAFCVNEKEVLDLIKASEENNTYLSEAMWTWFSKCSHKVKDEIEKGAIGEALSAKASFCFNGLGKGRVVDPKRAGGALLDVGVYPIAYMIGLFGTPDNVECIGKVKNGIDLSEKVILQFGNIKATCFSSINALIYRDGLIVVGKGGKIKSRDFHSSGKVVFKTKKGIFTIKETCSYLDEFNKVAEEIRMGKKESDYVPLKFSLAVIKVLDECRRQMGLVYDFEK